MDTNDDADVELPYHPSVHTLHNASRGISSPKMMGCDRLDRFSLMPKIQIQLFGSIGSPQSGEDVALVFLCSAEGESLTARY